jgi:hypothetical protein
MYQDSNAYILASQLLEDQGSITLHNARDVAKNLSDTGHKAGNANFVRVVRAMDLLLTDGGSGTVH